MISLPGRYDTNTVIKDLGASDWGFNYCGWFWQIGLKMKLSGFSRYLFGGDVTLTSLNMIYGTLISLKSIMWKYGEKLFKYILFETPSLSSKSSN